MGRTLDSAGSPKRGLALVWLMVGLGATVAVLVTCVVRIGAGSYAADSDQLPDYDTAFLIVLAGITVAVSLALLDAARMLFGAGHQSQGTRWRVMAEVLLTSALLGVYAVAYGSGPLRWYACQTLLSSCRLRGASVWTMSSTAADWRFRALTGNLGGSLAVATTNGAEESFTFDEVGNLVSDAVTDTGGTTFTYDAANRLTRSDYLEDTDGASALTTYYGWDTSNAWRTCQGPTPSPTQANSPIDLSYNALGRMSAYANADANTSATYTYDAAGQRTKKQVTVGSTTTTTDFAYDGLTLMKLSATQGTTPGASTTSATRRAPPGAASTAHRRARPPRLLQADHERPRRRRRALRRRRQPLRRLPLRRLGSPQGSGTYATGIWTQSTSLVTSTLAGQIASRQVLRYAAYAWDAESGLYYCSARYYDPATRQWTTGDPAKADGEESAYQYCGGSRWGRLRSGQASRVFAGPGRSCRTTPHT